MSSLLRHTLVLTLLLAGVWSSAFAQSELEVRSQLPAVSSELRTGDKAPVLLRHDIQELGRYRLECEVDMEIESGPLAGACTFSVLKKDSLLMTITGPFGILVGRFAASAQQLLYFDALNTEVLEATTDSPKVLERLPIPLNYNDLVHLMRSEVPFRADKYDFIRSSNGDSNMIYRYDEDPRYVDFVKCSATDGCVLSYQRKARSGEILLNLNYDDYELMSGVLFPRTIVMTIPAQKTVSRFRVSSLVLDPKNEHYSFSVPKGTKRTKLD